MRDNLKNARKKVNMTQQTVADMVHIGLRQYQRIESGEQLGSIQMWDILEDLFSVHQRVLRLVSCTHQGHKGNQD